MKLEYLDFDLLFEKSGEEYITRVLNSPCGQATSRFRLPFNPLQIENLLLRVGRTRRGVRRLESPEMETSRDFGRRLFESVFDNEVLGCLRSSLNESYRRGMGLRMKLRLSNAPELVDLPWEFLYDPSRNQFLVLSVETPLVRYFELPQDLQPLPVSPPLQVLVMIASPQDYPPLDVEREWAKLNEALHDLVRNGLVAITRLEPATLSSLQHQLRRGQYHIFHFIGHGAYNQQFEDGVLLIVDESGRGRPVSVIDLGTLLHDHRSLRLAVLNACEGARSSVNDPFAGAAQSLVQQGMPAVIAMQFEITDPAAITLAHEFYGALADGYSVDAALAESRKAIFAQGNDVEWATPVLYLRTPTGSIFQMGSSPATSRVWVEKSGAQAEELKVQANKLYTEGLSAYWLDEWEKACESFEAVLQLHPDHPEAAARLESARRNLSLKRLSEQAQAAETAKDWNEAVSLLTRLAADAPEYKEINTRLEAARKQQQLAELYEEASQVSRAGKWQAVVNIFAQITSIDPSAPDPEGLLASARRELEAQQRQAKLEADYNLALREIDAGRWEIAARLLRELQKKEPGYRQAARLLSRAEAEIAQLAKLASESTKTQTQDSPLRTFDHARPPEEPVLEQPLRRSEEFPVGETRVVLPSISVDKGTLRQALWPAILVGLGWFITGLLSFKIIESAHNSGLIHSIKDAANGLLYEEQVYYFFLSILMGILSGISLGIVLKAYRFPVTRGQFTALAVGWSGSNLFILFYAWNDASKVNSLLAWFLAGGLGGIVTSAVLRKILPRIGWQEIFLIVMVWAVSLALARWLYNTVYLNFIYNYLSSSFAGTFFGNFTIGLAAFTGGLASFCVLKSQADRTS